MIVFRVGRVQVRLDPRACLLRRVHHPAEPALGDPQRGCAVCFTCTHAHGNNIRKRLFYPDRLRTSIRNHVCSTWLHPSAEVCALVSNTRPRSELRQDLDVEGEVISLRVLDSGCIALDIVLVEDPVVCIAYIGIYCTR